MAALIFIWVSAVNDNELFNEVGKLAVQNRCYLWKENRGELTLAAKNNEISIPHVWQVPKGWLTISGEMYFKS